MCYPPLSTERGQEPGADKCGDCGEPVPVGGWPFCTSEANPEGHSKDVGYHFKAGFGMAAQGWTRRLR